MQVMLVHEPGEVLEDLWIDPIVVSLMIREGLQSCDRSSSLSLLLDHLIVFLLFLLLHHLL